MDWGGEVEGRIWLLSGNVDRYKKEGSVQKIQTDQNRQRARWGRCYEAKKIPESYGSKFTDNHILPSTSPPQSTTASVVSSQATFSDLYRSTFPDNNQILPSTSPPQSTTASVVSSQSTFSDLYRSTFPDNNYILPSTSPPQSTTASVVSSQATFSDLYRSTFPDNNQIRSEPILSNTFCALDLATSSDHVFYRLL